MKPNGVAFLHCNGNSRDVSYSEPSLHFHKALEKERYINSQQEESLSLCTCI